MCRHVHVCARARLWYVYKLDQKDYDLGVSIDYNNLFSLGTRLNRFL